MNILLLLHSVMRWFVLASLLYAIYRAYNGYTQKVPFTQADNKVRHWTATIAHIQLLIGIIIYTQSATVKMLANGLSNTRHVTEPVFFGVIHIALMLIAIVIITIGSAVAKRKALAVDKFRTQLIYFSLALAIIFIAIPWPFSPLAQRPFIRLS
jgi:uncharacterized membrane protein